VTHVQHNVDEARTNVWTTPMATPVVIGDAGDTAWAEVRDERSRRVEALVDLAAGLAHRIRNPLGTIAIYASLLERALEGNDPDRRLARSISEEVRRIDGIVGNLVIFARNTGPRPRPMDLARCIRDATAAVRPLAEARGVVVISRAISHSTTSEAELQADPELLQQAIVNLLVNAVQASPEGAAVCVQVDGAADHVVLSIADQGDGIPPEAALRAFDPFFTTRPGSTGLGLTIAHRVVAAHGGRLDLVPREGGGTCAVMALPRRPATTQGEN
jgi:signal transduction histidine kinase